MRKAAIEMIRKVLIRLLLGNKEELYSSMLLKGRIYRIVIEPYISPDEMLKRAANNGVFAAGQSKEEVL